GLNDLFAEYGVVDSAKVIMDQYSGRSRGFGFVEMPNSDEAKRAISELNQSDFKGKTLTVNEARPKVERPRNGDRNNYGSDRRDNRRW
ncbi:MAG: RNA-binding protein, partial [Prevotellaceae bacterium]|nr:RNA-binding protein [Prevotellaceae bacterium]